MTSPVGMIKQTLPVTMQARMILEEDGYSQVLRMTELNFEEQFAIQSHVDDVFRALLERPRSTTVRAGFFAIDVVDSRIQQSIEYNPADKASRGDLCIRCPTKEGGEAEARMTSGLGYGAGLSGFRIDEGQPLGALECPLPGGDYWSSALLRPKSPPSSAHAKNSPRADTKSRSHRASPCCGRSRKTWFLERYGVPNARCTFMTPDTLNSRFGIVTHGTQQPVQLDHGSMSIAQALI